MFDVHSSPEDQDENEQKQDDDKEDGDHRECPGYHGDRVMASRVCDKIRLEVEENLVCELEN